MGGDGVEQAAGDFVGVGVEEANPAQAFDSGQLVQQQRQAVFQTEVFAVASCVLADESNFAHTGLREALGFGNDGFETARAELAAKLRNDAERTGMVAAFGDLDVGRVAGVARMRGVWSSYR